MADDHAVVFQSDIRQGDDENIRNVIVKKQNRVILDCPNFEGRAKAQLIIELMSFNDKTYLKKHEAQSNNRNN